MIERGEDDGKGIAGIETTARVQNARICVAEALLFAPPLRRTYKATNVAGRKESLSNFWIGAIFRSHVLSFPLSPTANRTGRKKENIQKMQRSSNRELGGGGVDASQEDLCYVTQPFARFP